MRCRCANRPQMLAVAAAVGARELRCPECPAVVRLHSDWRPSVERSAGGPPALPVHYRADEWTDQHGRSAA